MMEEVIIEAYKYRMALYRLRSQQDAEDWSVIDNRICGDRSEL